MNSYLYYPGCSLAGTAREYGQSTLAVLRRLGCEIPELDDWTCCGASSAHSLDHRLGLALAARNLALAEAQGRGLLTPCAACYSRLAAAWHGVRQGGEVAEWLREILGRPLEGTFRPRSLLEFLVVEIGSHEIARQAGVPLDGLKVACYYGCLLSRPAEWAIDDADNPQLMDGLLEELGARAVPWAYKTECCGSFLALARTAVVFGLVERIVEAAREAGADCLVTACPMCQANLDMRQRRGRPPLPIFYFTQLVGVSLGLAPEVLGLDRHIIPGLPLLRERNLVSGPVGLRERLLR